MSSDRCYQCNTKFSLFKKGKPCHKCALLHCDGCLTGGAKDTAKIFSCGRCAETVKSRDVRAPPKAFIERIKKQNETPPSYSDTMQQKMEAGGEGMQSGSGGVPTDQEIATRLAKLSQSSATGGVPSDDQLRERLARLKDSHNSRPVNENQPSTSGSYLNTSHYRDVHLQQDPIKTPDDLIGKVREELVVDKGQQKDGSDSHMEQDPIKSPEDLIGKMREEIAGDRSRNPDAWSMDDHEEEEDDEEAATRRLIQKILEEDALEREIGCRLPVPSTVDPGSISPHANCEERELPWCVICNEDASVRCVDPECEASLYCLRCFTEDHRDSERKHHAKIKYTTRN